MQMIQSFVQMQAFPLIASHASLMAAVVDVDDKTASETMHELKISRKLDICIDVLPRGDLQCG